MILAGDVGATKILLEMGDLRSGRWKPVFTRRFATAREQDLAGAVESFLAEWERVEPKGQRVVSAAFGVAGPPQANRVEMTNIPWTVDADALRARFAIPRVRVVNDLVACAHGLDWLAPEEIATIQAGTPSASDPRVVLGVGSGLGVSYVVPIGGHLRELPGEGGHAGFAPATLEQAELWRSIFALRGRASAEDVVSGPGLVRAHAFVARRGAQVPGAVEEVAPERISKHAIDGSDPVCAAAVDLFIECLGNVAGDHALAVMARGGVYLTGGVVVAIASRLLEGRFADSFRAKGPMSSLMKGIPVRAVKSARVGVLGAARFALEGSP